MLAGRGDRPAFVQDGRVTSYRDCLRLLGGLRDALAAAGLSGGDTLAVSAGNRAETVLLQVAAQLRGVQVLLLPASASLPDRAAAIRESGATALAVDPVDSMDPGEPVLPEGPRPLWLGPVPPGRPGTDLLACPGDSEPRRLPLPDAVHVVFPSGGTTGTPKLIAHSGIYQAMAEIFPENQGEPERVLLVAPMTHMTGNATVLGALLSGNTVLVHRGFDAGAVLRALHGTAVASLSLTPPRLAALLDHPELARTDLSGLRSLSLGASPLSEHRLRQALRVFGATEVGQGYGLTEAPMIASISAGEFDGRPHRLGSVGRIVPGMEARIDGADSADGAEPGVPGEVLVRGLALMDGYHRRPELTAAAFTEGGWLRTGDVGRFDEEGYLYLLDRVNEVIITGEHGSKVYPALVENALTAHPGVGQAAVFGVPGPGGEGELVHAVVVPAPGAAPEPAALREHVRERLGRAHLVPAGIDLAAELPLTEVGKVDKRALRAPFWAAQPRSIA